MLPQIAVRVVMIVLVGSIFVRVDVLLADSIMSVRVIIPFIDAGTLSLIGNIVSREVMKHLFNCLLLLSELFLTLQRI